MCAKIVIIFTTIIITIISTIIVMIAMILWLLLLFFILLIIFFPVCNRKNKHEKYREKNVMFFSYKKKNHVFGPKTVVHRVVLIIGISFLEWKNSKNKQKKRTQVVFYGTSKI